ncbi:ArsR/SmtB family transcription factor [Lacrimispora xylanisolvens]|uniref:ArsR/SmtB family transcription factor n=1 Tax=Lacrimispora xylanisolvens TaxID=384636 RepID=UPI003D9C9222
MTDIFKALSEESRLRILTLLMEREMCVCEIEICLNMTQSNASRHLTVLKNCGILYGYKKAQWAYFGISDSFKKEHKELWEYLQKKIVELPTYESDHRQCEKYKNVDVCGNSKITEEGETE